MISAVFLAMASFGRSRWIRFSVRANHTWLHCSSNFFLLRTIPTSVQFILITFCRIGRLCDRHVTEETSPTSLWCVNFESVACPPWQIVQLNFCYGHEVTRSLFISFEKWISFSCLNFRSMASWKGDCWGRNHSREIVAWLHVVRRVVLSINNIQTLFTEILDLRRRIFSPTFLLDIGSLNRYGRRQWT